MEHLRAGLGGSSGDDDELPEAKVWRFLPCQPQRGENVFDSFWVAHVRFLK